jgi:hypothetical protein
VITIVEIVLVEEPPTEAAPTTAYKPSSIEI